MRIQDIYYGEHSISCHGQINSSQTNPSKDKTVKIWIKCKIKLPEGIGKWTKAGWYWKGFNA